MRNTKKLQIYLGAIGLFLLVIGISYAIFSANYLGSKEQEIVIGEDFIFSYNEVSNALSITNDDILAIEEGKMSDNYFDFSVKLKTSKKTDLDYYIYLTKDTTNTLDEKYVYTYLTDENDNPLVNETIISDLRIHERYANSYCLYENSITSRNNIETVHNYRLRVWVDNSYKNNYETNVTENGLHTSTSVANTYAFTVNVASGKFPRINLSPSWKNKTTNELNYLAIYTLDTKVLPETYDYNGVTYTKNFETDASEQTDGSVFLGEYVNGSDIIAVFGQDGGVVAPFNSSNLFNLGVYNLSAGVYQSNLQLIDLSNLDTGKVSNMSGMFLGCSSLTSLDVSSFDTSKVTDMYRMFSYCKGLTTLDLSNFDTRKVTTIESMFSWCTGLTSLNLTSFITNKVISMGYMFSGCYALTSIDLSKFNTSNVVNTEYMFNDCQNLETLNLSNFNTKKVEKMAAMFSYCKKLTSLDLSNFDTQKASDMSYMFINCHKLTSLNISGFVTTQVTNMTSMFNGCSSLANLNLSNFDTSNVTNMEQMFLWCSKLTTLDLSSFDTTNVTNMLGMFQNCTKLTEIKTGCNWVIGEETTTTDMFTSAGVSSVNKVC